MASAQTSAAQASSSTGPRKYTSFTDEQRAAIGKYAAIHGNAALFESLNVFFFLVKAERLRKHIEELRHAKLTAVENFIILNFTCHHFL